jgi:hypothetical protein
MDNIYGPSEEMEHNEINAPVEEYNKKMNKTQNNLMSSGSSESSGSDKLGMCGIRQYYHMYSIFHVIVGLFALYLSFRCNKGINVLDLLFALFCPVLYIIYRTAVCNESVGQFGVISVKP